MRDWLESVGMKMTTITCRKYMQELVRSNDLKQEGRRFYPISAVRRVEQEQTQIEILEKQKAEAEHRAASLEAKLVAVMPENMVGNMFAKLMSRFQDKAALEEFIRREKTRIQTEVVILDAILGILKGELPSAKHAEEIKMKFTDMSSGWIKAIR